MIKRQITKLCLDTNVERLTRCTSEFTARINESHVHLTTKCMSVRKQLTLYPDISNVS